MLWTENDGARGPDVGLAHLRADRGKGLPVDDSVMTRPVTVRPVTTRPVMRRGAALALARGAFPAWARHVIPLSIALFCLVLLRQQATQIDWANVGAAFAVVSPARWIGAALATGLSFWAVGQYDAVLHAALRTGVEKGRAARAGITAIAGAQTLGLGMITGSLLRWRMLPELTLPEATRITLVTALSFLAGWALVAAVVLTLVPPTPMLGWIGIGALVVCACAVIASTFWRSLPFPPLRGIATICGLVAIDTMAAALALYLLLPADTLSFAHLLPVFLLALGAGLVSGAPGGIGPFEVTLLGLSPGTEAETLIAGILAFRLVYFACPAVLAAVIAVRGARALPTGPRAVDRQINAPSLLHSALRAECGVHHQGLSEVIPVAQGGAVVARTRQSLVQLFDPICPAGSYPAALKDLQQRAKQEFRWPALYKCSARMAVTARRAGMSVMPIAQELWIDPAAFRLDRSACRQLRRKLRRAEAAGVSVARAGPVLPWMEMRDIARRWAHSRGGERGFSMGRFCPAYVAHQQVYLAHQKGRLVAFVTFHRSQGEVTLDLMRSSDQTPDGTLHALIHAALVDAARDGVPRVSLAALPLRAPDQGRDSRLQTLLGNAVNCDGLRQFKHSFAPNRETLYLAAPGPVRLALIGAEIAREIAHPRALPAPDEAARRYPPSDRTHNHYDGKEIAHPGLS